MVPKSRIAVVTGANKGIGYFIALQLGLSGLFSDIILGCRDSGRGTAARNAIQETIESSLGAGGKGAPTIHSLPLTIGDAESHSSFSDRMEKEFGGRVDVLVNNAGFAYKGADPTPFRDQTQKTLETNYYGLLGFTQSMLPLLRRGTDPRIVNVASMAGRLSQVSPELQQRFSDPALTIEELNGLMAGFEDAVLRGTHRGEGFSNSNYGMSKLGVIAATKVLAREEKANGIAVNCCCPGYCDTDMTSHRGPRSPAEGARNAFLPATMENPPTGAYFANERVARW